MTSYVRGSQILASQTTLLTGFRTLSGCTQHVQLSGLLSSYVNIIQGVLQGSILGPILFTIYADNVGQNITDAS